MGGFVEMFRSEGSAGTPDSAGADFARPAWIGPPEDEVGRCVPLAIVVARSEKGAVALRQVTAFSTGITFNLLAGGRDLREPEAQRLFHEQHLSDPDEGVSEGFLRIGIELPDGQRVSNLSDRRRLWAQPNEQPGGPVLMRSGGGGSSAGAGRVQLDAVYWLWPLPPPGTLRLFVEWPALDIPLASVDIDGDRILAAASESQPLWND
jgi:hypothetical protein